MGPEMLDLLAGVAARPGGGELALLHTSREDGLSVLAVEPLLTIEVDHRGTARWVCRPIRRPRWGRRGRQRRARSAVVLAGDAKPGATG